MSKNVTFTVAMEGDNYLTQNDMDATNILDASYRIGNKHNLHGSDICSLTATMGLSLESRGKNPTKKAKKVLDGAHRHPMVPAMGTIYTLMANAIPATWDLVPNRKLDYLGRMTEFTYRLIGRTVVAVGDKIEIHQLIAGTAVIICNELHISDVTDVKYGLNIVANKVVINGTMSAGSLNIVAREVSFKLKGLEENESPVKNYRIITPKVQLCDMRTMVYVMNLDESEFMDYNGVVAKSSPWKFLDEMLAIAYDNLPVKSLNVAGWIDEVSRKPHKALKIMDSQWSKLRIGAQSKNTKFISHTIGRNPDISHQPDCEITTQVLNVVPNVPTVDTIPAMEFSEFVSAISHMNLFQLKALVNQRLDMMALPAMEGLTQKKEYIAALQVMAMHTPFFVDQVEEVKELRSVSNVSSQSGDGEDTSVASDDIEDVAVA